MSIKDKNILEAYNENPWQFCLFELENIKGGKKAINKFDVIVSEIRRLATNFDIDINGASIVRDNKKLYVLGGFTWERDETLHVDEYGETSFTNSRKACGDVFCVKLNDSSFPWQVKASLSKPRYGFGCTLHNGEIFVAGGDDKRNILNSVESYNPLLNKWNTKPHMMKQRAGCALTSKDNLLYALGGCHGFGIKSNSVEVYDSMLWKPGPSMLKKRSHFQVAVLNDEIYAIGGRANFFGYLSHVEKLTNEGWKEVASLNIPRSHYQVIVVCGKIYVYGGENMFGSLKALEIFDTGINQWSTEVSYFEMITSSDMFLGSFAFVVLVTFALLILICLEAMPLS